MKYKWTPKSGTRKFYDPKWTIIKGPDARGVCECYDEVIKSTVFLHIDDLSQVDRD